MRVLFVAVLALAAAHVASARDLSELGSPPNYWVLRVGPSDDMTQYLDAPQRTFHLSFGGTHLGLPSGDLYMQGGRAMEKFGFAKVFGSDRAAALKFLDDRSGRGFDSWQEMVDCGLDSNCDRAWVTDSRLLGKNATVTRLLWQVNARATMRCHAHPQGTWCHEKTKSFNQGEFFIVEALADGETASRVGLVMCHKWPEGSEELFKGVSRCHTLPYGLVVPILPSEMPKLEPGEGPSANQCGANGEDCCFNPCCSGLKCGGGGGFQICHNATK